MVAVPELPEDAARFVPCLADAGYFEAIGFTVEDRQRAAQYAANAEREALLGSSESVDDFLRGLKMSVSFGPIGTLDLVRATQLINKTNQFNPTTRRYTGDELAALAAAPENVTLQFRLLDRFSDNGLVSAMILRPDPGEPEVLEIDTWVMSCRVFGRDLEREAMNVAVEAASHRGVRSFRASYIPTKKNGVISNLYPSLGFARMEQTVPTDGATRWYLNLADYEYRPTHIARTSK
jgi:FkbH-like protein